MRLEGEQCDDLRRSVSGGERFHGTGPLGSIGERTCVDLGTDDDDSKQQRAWIYFEPRAT